MAAARASSPIASTCACHPSPCDGASDDDDRVHTGILNGRREGLAIHLCRSCQLQPDVHGILHAGARAGDHIAQPRLRLVREIRQLQTGLLAGIGRGDRRPARTGDDGHAVTGRPPEVAQSHEDIEQLVEIADLDRAGLAQHPRPHLRLAGQGTGVGVGSPRTTPGASHLPDHQVFAAAGGGESAPQASPVLGTLDVGGDDLGLRVLRQVLQEVRGLQIVLVADAHDLAEGERPFSAAPDQAIAQRPAL